MFRARAGCAHGAREPKALLLRCAFVSAVRACVMASTRVAAHSAQPRLVICVGDRSEVGGYLRAAEGHLSPVEEVIHCESTFAGNGGPTSLRRLPSGYAARKLGNLSCALLGAREVGSFDGARRFWTH